MAETPLPSREEAQAEWDKEGAFGADTMEWAALRGIAEGRLVDREAIDYGAVAAMAVVPLADYGSLDAWAHALIDAAIGDTDERENVDNA